MAKKTNEHGEDSLIQTQLLGFESSNSSPFCVPNANTLKKGKNETTKATRRDSGSNRGNDKEMTGKKQKDQTADSQSIPEGTALFKFAYPQGAHQYQGPASEEMRGRRIKAVTRDNVVSSHFSITAPPRFVGEKYWVYGDRKDKKGIRRYGFQKGR